MASKKSHQNMPSNRNYEDHCEEQNLNPGHVHVNPKFYREQNHQNNQGQSQRKVYVNAEFFNNCHSQGHHQYPNEPSKMPHVPSNRNYEGHCEEQNLNPRHAVHVNPEFYREHQNNQSHKPTKVHVNPEFLSRKDNQGQYHHTRNKSCGQKRKRNEIDEQNTEIQTSSMKFGCMMIKSRGQKRKRNETDELNNDIQTSSMNVGCMMIKSQERTSNEIHEQNTEEIDEQNIDIQTSSMNFGYMINKNKRHDLSLDDESCFIPDYMDFEG